MEETTTMKQRNTYMQEITSETKEYIHGRDYYHESKKYIMVETTTMNQRNTQWKRLLPKEYIHERGYNHKTKEYVRGRDYNHETKEYVSEKITYFYINDANKIKEALVKSETC
ncbi:hypothetical protein CDAR_580061 [Caerostris darwini]|uniref:Uncharacterized protein n=1 Tax=Caerostris darwini TaxID=1538125 RepID=A0AAV4PRQ4_9ARAC|nr:hypothetical protein CDAR_580061 [Caerostris darwini]